MKKIDYKFTLMGVVFLLFGLAMSRILMIVAGAAFILYSFISKGMAPTKKNIFKSGPIVPKKKKKD